MSSVLRVCARRCLAAAAPLALALAACGDDDPAGGMPEVTPEAGVDPVSDGGSPPAVDAGDATPGTDAGSGTLCKGADCPTLLKDIVRTLAVHTHSKPHALTVVGSGPAARVYFVATDDANGGELWMSDGTLAGTRIVKDLPGTPDFKFGELVAVDTTLYFTVYDGVHGRELWKSDGTAAGTVLVTDLYPGIPGADPTKLTAVGSRLFFSANAGGGERLFVTDGTSAGTIALPVLAPTALLAVSGKLYVSGTPSSAQPFGLFVTDGTVAGTNAIAVPVVADGTQVVTSTLHLHAGKVYFMSRLVAPGPLKFPALWATDGTGSGTHEIKSGFMPDSTYPTTFATVGSTLYFSARTLAEGNELWKSDGTTGGTVLVKNINSGNDSSNPTDFTVLNGKLVFTAGIRDGGSTREVWASDGTAAGTDSISEIDPAGLADPKNLTVLGGKLYFVADDSEHGRELWQSDGTYPGTMIVKDIAPGSAGSDITEIVALGGKLLFPANNGVNGIELFASDGTGAGTTLVKDIAIASRGGGTRFTAVNGKVIFVGEDWPTASENNAEPWLTDGTTAGTSLLKDIHAAGSSFPTIDRRYVFGKTAFFPADDGTHGIELWASDGTSAGTRLVKDLHPGADGANPSKFTSFAGSVFFTTHANVRSLWKTDGTEAGTVDLAPGKFTSFPNDLGPVALNGALLFVARSAAYGSELWKTDGTAAGTVLLKDINAGPADGAGSSEVVFKGALYFEANTPGEGTELWKTDGTAAGTVLVKDINEGPGNSSPVGFFEHGGMLYFVADDGEHGFELWKTDGTTTSLVKDINPGKGNSVPRQFTAAAGTLFFLAERGALDLELWKTDGTEAGTTLVKDIRPGPEGAFGSLEGDPLFDVGGAVVFIADDGVHGRELWRSDGTEAGTVLLKDLWPGPWSGASSVLTQPVKGGPLLFKGSDGIAGVELWRTDGTAAGTGLFFELTPGPGSTRLFAFGEAGDRVYFNAGNGASWALWSLPTSALK